MEQDAKRNVKEKGSGRDRRVLTFGLTGETVREKFAASAFFDGMLVGIVVSGTARVTVNYKPYTLEPGVLLLLHLGRLYHWDSWSDDFYAHCLTVERDYMREMDSAEMVSRRARYGARLLSRPVFRLHPEQLEHLVGRMSGVGESVARTGHPYYDELVVTSLNLFYLDLSAAIDRFVTSAGGGEPGLTRRDMLIERFIELVIRCFRKHHTVDFYAGELGVSAHYLTLLVRQATGQTVSDLIYSLLYGEACVLLVSSRLSIGEIAYRLNFSDQSAFRKFFKRKSGRSPIDYRKGKAADGTRPSVQPCGRQGCTEGRDGRAVQVLQRGTPGLAGGQD